MKIIKTSELPKERIVEYSSGVSNRILLKEDNCGFTLTKTVVAPGTRHFQHYKNHIESCYCVSGKGILTKADTGEEFEIEQDTTYILDSYDPHYFEAVEETVLICVFNPPLTGREVHDEEGSYPAQKNSTWESPVYSVKSVHISQVQANDYNPNAVAPPEMELLETSIWEDGYTQPVVVVFDKENKKYVVVDGFHRYLVCKNSERINKREGGMLPVVELKKDMSNRMASTIRHNRARGTHNIELMSSIVAELIEMGKSDRWICVHIGMSPDELLRLKQVTGLASLFLNKDFSDSWDISREEEQSIHLSL
jgi:mannose-6-phosphate isomerase-like protein (cupin superfamily)